MSIKKSVLTFISWLSFSYSVYEFFFVIHTKAGLSNSKVSNLESEFLDIKIINLSFTTFEIQFKIRVYRVAEAKP